MQRIQKWCAERFEQCFASRTAVLLLTFFMLAVFGNIHTRWSKTLFYFFIMPVQMGMSYLYIRDKAIRMDGVFRLVCVSLLWCLMSTMLNTAWSTGGMITHWTMLGTWIFALFVPRQTGMKQVHKELFHAGLIYMICFAPFILIALYSVFSGKVIYVLGEHTPVGIQKAGVYGSRIRIMMNPNKIGIILVFDILFAIYGLVTHRKKAWRAYFIFILIINVMACAHVMSRTSIMGLAAAMGVFGFRVAYRALGRKKLLRIFAGLLACVLVFFLVVFAMDWIYEADVALAKWINNDQQSADVLSRSDEFGTFDATSSGRGEIWSGVMQLLREEPSGLALGYGSNDVMQMMADVTGDPGMAEMVHVHSSYLDCVVRGGIPYLLMVLAFLVILIKPAWQLGVGPATEETRGLFVVPMFVVALLVMSVSEVMLFVDKSHTNYLFMMMCGYLLHYRGLHKEQRLSA